MDIQELKEKKEKVYSFLKSEEYVPMKLKELANLLQVPRQEKEGLKEIVDKLVSDGLVLYDQKGHIKLAADGMKAGYYMGTAKGFGFVRVEGEEEDIFIPADKTGSAHDKDKVLISIMEGTSKGRSREGEVVSVLERADDKVTGTFQRTKTYGFVIPDNRKFGSDIYIPHGFTKGAVTGHKVVVELTDFGGQDKKPEGHVTEIIGHIDDPGTDILSVIRAFGIPLEFPDGVIEELKSIPVEVAEEDKEGRLDLRSEKTITIDSETAKDLDDAVTIYKKDGMYTLGVHIADVSEYVRENSALDKEALKRGTSNYLIDSVIPMLPHELSNGICSLNQGVDRLALSCIMDITPKGEIKGHRIAETVINVDRRMTYTNVQRVNDAIDAYDGTEEELFTKLADKNVKISDLKFKEELPAQLMDTLEEYRDFAEMFRMCLELSDILRQKRHKRGSIDFDIPECEISVDEKGRPIEIKPYDRNRATKIIEDFMLAANETVAEDYFWQELPFVYRTHDTPDPEKITKLGIFINNFGYTIKMGNDDIHPKELQKLLEKIEGSDEEAMISRLTLRSMKQAKYTTTCDGHFGLASKYYCHFTSPIRRYPDLQIHRIIKENLRGKLNDKRINHYSRILSDVAFLSSKCERRADEAEREVQKLKKIEYMEPHIGEIFDGVISGISTMGVYIELPNTVEGIVRIENIKDDFYFFDEEHYQLIGRNNKKCYNLGQRVKVKLEEADKLLRSIVFSFAEDEADGT